MKTYIITNLRELRDELSDKLKKSVSQTYIYNEVIKGDNKTPTNMMSLWENGKRGMRPDNFYKFKDYFHDKGLFIKYNIKNNEV